MEHPAQFARRGQGHDQGEPTPALPAPLELLYTRDLDLVAVAPDGRLAGFCVGWPAPRDGVAQIEPMGVDPDFQGRGLARALLLAMCGRMRDHGARAALVETTSDRAPALAAYQAAGFQPAPHTLRKGRWLTAPPPRLE